MAEAKGNHAPIRQSVHVDCPIEDAFLLFTERFAEWWPLASYSISGEEAEKCAIEPWVGGRVFERTRSGEELEWGSVIAFDPPERLEFTWHPDGQGDRSQTVDVQFQVEADGTRVTLIHTGWDVPGVMACALHADYTESWPAILRICFAEFISERMLQAV
jgi:uncharacterized protein YndB with AHSA1/START domain